MKTKIDQEIYCLFEDQLTLERVGFIGKDSFILDRYNDYREECRELYYEDYNKTWFKSFDSACKALLKTRSHKDYFVAQVADGCWELFAGPQVLEDSINDFKKKYGGKN